MKQFYFFSIAIVFLLLSQNSWGQVKLGDNPENIDPAALLELESTTKGLLLPRMTSAQRDALPMDTSPVGLLIYNTDIDEIQYLFEATVTNAKGDKRQVLRWESATDSSIPLTQPTSPVTGQLFYNTTLGQLNLWDGTQWIAVGGSTTNSGVVSPTISYQTLSLAGSQLTISNGNSVDLLTLVTSTTGAVGPQGPAGPQGNPATDDQSLTASALSANNTMTLAISGGNTLTLDFAAISPTGLVSVTEGGNTGHRLATAKATNHGDIGTGAIDLSTQTTASTNTGARGNYSFAAGRDTEASGQYSFAGGFNTLASGNNSWAGGFESVALGESSFAFGINNTASGTHAVSFGFENRAIGDYSFALGFENKAIGNYSTAFGIDTEAQSFGETVFGINNTLYTPTGINSFENSDRLLVVGNGAGSGNRSDALVILKDGTTTLNGALTINVTSTTASYTLPLAGGTNGQVLSMLDATTGTTTWTTNSGGGLFTTNGNRIISSVGSITHDFIIGSNLSDNITGSGDDARFFFDKSKGAFRAGYASLATWNDANIGDRSIAFGYNTEASGDRSTAFGNAATALSYAETALGSYNALVVPLSKTLWNANDRLFVIGNGTSTSARSDALVMLKDGTTTLNGALTINMSSTTSSYTLPLAGGTNGQVLSMQDATTGTTTWTTLTGGGVAQLLTASALSDTNTLTLDITGGNTVTLDLTALAPTGLVSVTEGGNTGHRIATRDENNHGDIGANAVDLSYQTGTSAVSGATGTNTLAWGRNTTASGDNATVWGTQTTAVGTQTTAWGLNNSASGDNATVWGVQNTSSGERATAWGLNNSAIGEYATVWGFSTTASATGATAWGEDNVATANNATAWGENTEATGAHATSWGVSTTASNDYTTAWGEETEATSDHATAWGDESSATGRRATAFGEQTLASGDHATAWGRSSVAAGSYTTAWGRNTTAETYGQTTLGTYNTAHPGSPNATSAVATDRLFVIGNGTSTSARSDALVILKDGTTTLNGALTINASSATTSYTLPLAGGTNGQVLTMQDATTGTTTWTTLTGGGVAQNINSLNYNTATASLTVGISGGTSQEISLATLGSTTVSGTLTVNQATRLGSSTLLRYPGTYAAPGSSSAILGIEGAPDARLRLIAAATDADSGIRAPNIDLYANSAGEDGGRIDFIAGNTTALTVPPGGAAMRFYTYPDLSTRIQAMTISSSGTVGIGDATPDEGTLVVSGTIVSSGNMTAGVTLTPDYVFEQFFKGRSNANPNYEFPSLEEVEAFVKENHHLPNIPSAAEVEKQGGIILNRASELQLEKIEELYLHTIQQQKAIQRQQEEIDALKEMLALLLKERK